MYYIHIIIKSYTHIRRPRLMQGGGRQGWQVSACATTAITTTTTTTTVIPVQLQQPFLVYVAKTREKWHVFCIKAQRKTSEGARSEGLGRCKLEGSKMPEVKHIDRKRTLFLRAGNVRYRVSFSACFLQLLLYLFWKGFGHMFRRISEDTLGSFLVRFRGLTVIHCHGVSLWRRVVFRWAVLRGGCFQQKLADREGER